MPPGTRIRKRITPVTWIESGNSFRLGIDGKIPNCVPCAQYLFSSRVIEAMGSVSVECSKEPLAVAKDLIEYYHSHLHAGM